MILQIYTNIVKRYGRKIVEIKYIFIRLTENGQEEWGKSLFEYIITENQIDWEC